MGDASRSWRPMIGVSQADFLREHRATVCSLSASYISTLAGYPLDTLKSRLQTYKGRSVSVPKLAAMVYREEGVAGFFRGLWIPLTTISFVRAASFTIYSNSKEYLYNHHLFPGYGWKEAGAIGALSGASSGALITIGTVPFELVKIRRQLEFIIAASQGRSLTKPPSTTAAVADILRSDGISGLYSGFRLHALRDTLGSALYFAEYDAMRTLLGRSRDGTQGPTPNWLPIPGSIIPFVCGSLAGVTSWALIYPLDVVKTKVQQRALAHERPRGVYETFYRLIRGPDPAAPKPWMEGISRMYRGLSVSALRSITTHGLLWTFIDLTSHFIDTLPRSELG